MNLHSSAAALALVMSIWSYPAIACRTLADRDAKAAASDLVVDGEAQCDATAQQCRLKVIRTIKGSASKGELLTVFIDYPSNPDPHAANIEIGCANSWVPESDEVKGRFYLSNSDGRLTAPYETDVKSEK